MFKEIANGITCILTQYCAIHCYTVVKQKIVTTGYVLCRKRDKYVEKISRQQRQDARASFISTDIPASTAALKNEGGKTLAVWGCEPDKTFIQADPVGIYRLSVRPIALGTSKPLFEDLKSRLKLSLLKTDVFKSGVV